ncbi:MAG: hypothetical protein ACXWV6_08080 [Chitinophagaceae bacterium]
MKKQPSQNDKNQNATSKLTPRERIEQDADDLVHSRQDEPAETGEEDPDDLVHRSSKHSSGTVINNDNMEDPDDLVHGYPPDEEQG